MYVGFRGLGETHVMADRASPIPARAPARPGPFPPFNKGFPLL